jgi:hypothetical protein
MRTFTFILAIVVVGCQSPKEEYDFTFFKWNIIESYYMKFNSSDTLYLVNAYPPFEGETSFTILSSEEKIEIENKIYTIDFPKKKVFDNTHIEDGKTFAFVLRKNKQYNELKIHGNAGPNQFWLFGNFLEEIKNRDKFTKLNKKFKFSEVEKMFKVPPPPIIGK